MDKRSRFRKLHDSHFLIPNPWDIGSARLLASLGFEALATTSGGHAASLGRLDGEVTRDEAIEHAHAIAYATPLPVSADLENGFGDAPSAVEKTVSLASAAGLAGCSIEDYGGEADPAIYDLGLAVDRIRAAVDTSRRDADPLVLTARAENYIRGRPELADTIARLQAFQEAGADVLYAPGLSDLEEIKTLVTAVDRPVNVLILPGGPKVSELFDAGATRISVGSALSLTAHAAVVEAVRELRDEGTHEFWSRALASAGAIHSAFSSKD